MNKPQVPTRSPQQSEAVSGEQKEGRKALTLPPGEDEEKEETQPVPIGPLLPPSLP